MTIWYGLMGATAIMLMGWLIAQSRDDKSQPIRSRVSIGQGMASLGLVAGLLTLPTDLPPTTYSVGLVLVLLWGLVMIRGAGRLAVGWTSMAEVLTSAAGLAWVRPGRALWSAVCLGAGLWVAVLAGWAGQPRCGPPGCRAGPRTDPVASTSGLQARERHDRGRGGYGRGTQWRAGVAVSRG